MKNLTVYQVKEIIHNILIDDYCLEKREISKFLECLNDNLIFAIAHYHVTANDIINTAMKWGNHKVMNCIGHARQVDEGGAE